eukprot:TRINITY_DN5214_c0_g3_i4.p1 TRINITY_DN5214_c0_g3~~TRINITY_DN5214_c0_g3_i4.p1  ORF type:complete len:306 (-),score=58.37 TRINITY_DN5214_c0_g3_i4:974-1891(-)
MAPVVVLYRGSKILINDLAALPKVMALVADSSPADRTPRLHSSKSSRGSDRDTEMFEIFTACTSPRSSYGSTSTACDTGVQTVCQVSEVGVQCETFEEVSTAPSTASSVCVGTQTRDGAALRDAHVQAVVPASDGCVQCDARGVDADTQSELSGTVFPEKLVDERIKILNDKIAMMHCGVQAANSGVSSLQLKCKKVDDEYCDLACKYEKLLSEHNTTHGVVAPAKFEDGEAAVSPDEVSKEIEDSPNPVKVPDKDRILWSDSVPADECSSVVEHTLEEVPYIKSSEVIEVFTVGKKKKNKGKYR